MDEQLKMMQQYMGDGIVRGILVPQKLRAYLDEHPIDPVNDFDLNPHIHIKSICELIAKQIEVEGVSCTYEDVMQQWLTVAVYHGELIAPKTIKIW